MAQERGSVIDAQEELAEQIAGKSLGECLEIWDAEWEAYLQILEEEEQAMRASELHRIASEGKSCML